MSGTIQYQVTSTVTIDFLIFFQMYTYICNYCTKEYKSEEDVIFHIRKRHMVCYVNPYECCICSAHFSKRVNLKHHLVTLHGVMKDAKGPYYGIKPYTCFENCDAKFSSKIDLKQHMREVHGWGDCEHITDINQ